MIINVMDKDYFDIENLWENIPLHWSLVPLKYLCSQSALYGANISADAYSENGVRFLRTSDIREDGTLEPEGVYVSGELVDNYILNTNDLIISRSGTVGRAFIYSDKYGICAYAGYLVRFIFNSRQSPKYYFYITKSLQFQLWLGTSAVEATIGNVNGEKYANILLPNPPLSEQFSIANYLDRETAKIDTLISAKERLLDLLTEKRHAIINDAVTHGLTTNPTLKAVDIPWLDRIPKHWRVERGRYLFIQSSLAVRENDEIVTCFRDGQVTLRRNRREQGFTNAIQELGYQGIRSGQLVLHSMDAFAGAIGISDSDGKCSPEYIICDPANESVFNPYYAHLLRFMALQGFIQANCPAVRERAPRIHFSDLAEILLPIPPIEEQKAIVSHIATKTLIVDNLRIVATKTMKLIHERRITLIAAAVTGQICVRP